MWAAVEKNPDCAPEQLVRFSDHEATLTARDSEIERLKATLNNPWNPSLCPICSRDASGKTIECCPTHSRIAGLELNCELRDREITELKATKDDIILGLESKVERLQISLNASRQDKDRQLAARDQTISEQQTFINEDARKIAEQAKRIEEQNTQIDAWRTHIERLNKDVSLADLVVSDKNKRFAGLEAKLHILIGASGSAVEVLDDCGCDVEAGRLQNAVNAALSSDQPSHEQPPTDHFEDAKRTIASWPQWKRDVFSRDLADPQPFAEEKGKCVRCGHGPCFYNKVMAEPTGTVEKKE